MIFEIEVEVASQAKVMMSETRWKASDIFIT